MLSAIAVALLGPFALQEPPPPPPAAAPTTTPAPALAPLPPPPPPPPPAPPPPPVVYAQEEAPPPVVVARAPGERTHDGFYARIALGFGGVGVNGTAPGGGDASIRGGGASLLLALGGTPAPGLAIGGALMGVSNGNQTFAGGPSDLGGANWNGGFGALDLFVDWFPDPKDGWHIGGMLGYAGVQAGESTYDTKWFGHAANARLFGGYDFWIGSQLSLGLGAALDATTTASLFDSHNYDTGYRLRASAFIIDVSLLWH